MSWEVRWFIRSAMVWLVLGVALGLGLAIAPVPFALLRPAHLHMNLLGFMSLMIFGVAYHILPRFTGARVRSEALIRANLAFSNLGLAVMVLGWMVRQFGFGAPDATSAVLLALGGILAGAGAVSFVTNTWDMVSSAPPSSGMAPGPAMPCGGTPPEGRLIQLGRDLRR